MKKLLVLSAIFFLYIHISSGQAYRPFLNDSAHWTMIEHECIGPCDPGDISNPNDCYTSNTYTYKLSGDTVVNSFTYKKLTQNIVYSARSGTNQPYNYPYNNFVSPCTTVGLLWEDTIARKVYIKKIDSTSLSCSRFSDSLFFDFSISVGDTTQFAGECVPYSTNVKNMYAVDSINYTDFGINYPIKTWYLRCIPDSGYLLSGPLMLYESIGSSFGFFGFYPFFEGSYTSALAHYAIGSDSACGFICSFPVGITSPTLQSISISVYPNPAKGTLTLDMVNMSPGEYLRFVLTDIVGQTVHSAIITNTKTEIDISAFSSGIYIWHLVSDGNIIRSGKVVHE